MAPVQKNFDTPSSLVDELSQHISDILLQAIDDRGRASMAVSGGSTPGALFRVLSRLEIPWSQVIVSLVDERWVEESHPDSNAALVRRTLLQNRASSATFVTMKTQHADAFAAQCTVQYELETRVLPLDLVLLGMGNDGHTASLFPDAEGLTEALDTTESALCHGIAVEGMPYTRMTLTLKAILGARYRILQIQGEAKKKTLLSALQPGPIIKMPVRALLNTADVDIEIYYSP